MRTEQSRDTAMVRARKKERKYKLGGLKETAEVKDREQEQERESKSESESDSESESESESESGKRSGRTGFY